jgi:hypothetical protein
VWHELVTQHGITPRQTEVLEKVAQHRLWAADEIFVPHLVELIAKLVARYSRDGRDPAACNLLGGVVGPLIAAREMRGRDIAAVAHDMDEECSWPNVHEGGGIDDVALDLEAPTICPACASSDVSDPLDQSRSLCELNEMCIAGHFGRDEPEFTWENTDRAGVLRAAAGL